MVGFFWYCLSLEILWLIWKFHNDDVFIGKSRNLTESLRRLIFHLISLQVTVVLRLDEGKFDQWIKDGFTIIYLLELSDGCTWDRVGSNNTMFEQALLRFMHQLEQRQARMDVVHKEEWIHTQNVHLHVEQIVNGLIEVWMEGDNGWIAWFPLARKSSLSDTNKSFDWLWGVVLYWFCSMLLLCFVSKWVWCIFVSFDSSPVDRTHELMQWRCNFDNLYLIQKKNIETRLELSMDSARLTWIKTRQKYR